jgi:diaminopimelate epimerase
MKIPFMKMSGSGNDFILIDHRDRRLDEERLAAFVVGVCRRRLSVGADGVILVERSGVADFRWRFFNADGSPAAMCGNGARCAARFAVERGLSGSPLELVFPGFSVEARVEGATVSIRAPRPAIDEVPRSLPLPDGGSLPARLVRAGVPHLVAREPAGTRLDLADLAARLRAADPELAGAVNLTLVREASERTLFVRTFERGSGETLACGSGAWAAAAFCESPPGGGGSFEVYPPAGFPLTVELAPSGGGALLSGPARVVFRGLLAEE